MEHEEIRERYFARRRYRHHFWQADLMECEFDAISPATVNRISAPRLVGAARWAWNQRALHQAFCGVRGVPSHPEYGPLTPRSSPAAEAPQVKVSNVVLREFSDPTRSNIPSGKMFATASGRARAWCGLFGVSKTESLLRLVFDSRPGNLWFDRNEAKPFALFTLAEFLAALDAMLSRPDPKRPLWFVSGDLRHFYYQMPMSPAYAPFNAVRVGGSVWFPLVLVMGWFASCYWAQAATITMLLHREEHEDSLGASEEGMAAGMPTAVRLRTPKGATGFLFVLMDGFIIITDDRELKDRWCRRIRRNMRFFNAELKLVDDFETYLRRRFPELSGDDPAAKVARTEGNRPTPAREEQPQKVDIVVSTRGAVFNGIVIVAGKGWTTEADPGLFPAPSGSRREWASLLGRLLWSLRVDRSSLLDHLDLLSVYRQIHGDREVGWDDPPSKPVDFECLRRLWAHYNVTRWCSPRPPPTISQVYALATDAFTRGKGYIVWRFDGAAIRVASERHTPTAEAPQMAQEADAVADGLEHIFGTAPAGAGVRVVVGLDPDPVRYAYQKEYSGSEALQQPLLRYLALRRSRPCDVRFVRVPGVDLVADVTSRGVYAYQTWRNPPGTPAAPDLEHRKRETERILQDACRLCA